MADTIQYDPSKHSELKNKMGEIETSYSEVITAFENVLTVVSSDFKGEAAAALQTALQTKVQQLNTEKESWATVIDNAAQVEQAFITADDNAKKAVSDIIVEGGRVLQVM